MFYRRKIVLSVINAFEELTSSECQSVIFLFCEKREKNYYDFLPDHAGCFSFLLQQDIHCLESSGLLISRHGTLQCSHAADSSNQITAKDRNVLSELAVEVGNRREKNLISMVYQTNPHYVSRLQRYSFIPEAVEPCGQSIGDAQTPCLFTLGYEGLSVDAYLDTLLLHRVVALVDVRNNPISRKHGFSKARLEEYLKRTGIEYYHTPELGIPSALRRNLTSAGAYQDLFELYASSILPVEERAIKKLKMLLLEQKRIVLTCFEADYHFCHRHKIAEYLEHDPDFAVSIVHLNRTFAFSGQKVYTDPDRDTLHVCK